MMNDKVNIINLREVSKTIAILPRTQCIGVEPQSVNASDFELQTIESNQGKKYMAVVQKAFPRMVFQVIRTATAEQFEEYLGMLLGIAESPVYIKGTQDIVIFQGALDFVKLTQSNCEDVAATIIETCKKAAQWWYENKENINKQTI